MASNSYRAAKLCTDCGARPAWSQTRYCKPCMGKRISQGKARAAKRTRFPGVDIDAIHFNPRWMKKKLKEAA